VDALCEALEAKADELGEVVKVGRTHLQDATPVTLGQEIGAWAAQLREAQDDVRHAGERVLALAIGGTAVGTGLNAPAAFGPTVAEHLAAETGLAFRQAHNLFGGMMKLANDVRWLASGPRTGIGELRIPENEPGSSIMPGKVNPTQSEAMTMVVTRVFGNDATVGFAGTQGNFQLNVFTPVMAHAVLESIRLVADSCRSFTTHLVLGLEADRDRIAEHLEDDLMLVTALAPHIGYDTAAAIAKQAHRDGSTLREAAVASGAVSEEDYERWVDPEAMTRPG
jgi:fumarate hydratase class II